MKTAVAYLRKSTENKQEHSFERQLVSIQAWAEKNDVKLVGIFQEAVSGKYGLDMRPQLQAAFATGETVVVSSVDRLSRNVAVGAALLESRSVIVSDLGMSCDSLILNVLLCVAAKERELISERTKQGLARAKSRGAVLGNPNLDAARLKSMEANRKRGDRTVEEYRVMIEAAQEAGCSTTTAIAEYLNRFGVKTTRGKDITPTFVWRLLRKMED